MFPVRTWLGAHVLFTPWLMVLLGNSSIAAAQETLTLTAAGRTLTATSEVPAGAAITIKVATPADVTICNATAKIKQGDLKLRFIVLPDVTPPRELGINEGTSISAANGVFTIPAPAKGSYVLFNLSQDATTDGLAALETCWAAASARKLRLGEHEDDATAAERTIKELEALIPVLRLRIESQRTDAATFGGRAASAERVAAILKRVEETRVELQKAESGFLAAQNELRDARQALEDAEDVNIQELGMKLADAEYTIKRLSAGALLKVGGIVTGQSKAAYYDFASFSTRSSLQMTPMGAFPVMRFGERIFAIIANVLPSEHPYGFHLTALAQDTAAVNTDPVRPTFDVATGETASVKGKLPTQRTTSRAYTDVILAVRGSFAPNQYPEVTISTERASDDDPKKRTTITLVDKARYPQFRALYRYNFSTGVFGSKLRSAEFRKVKTRDDDPGTDIDEARFRVDQSLADASVKPIFAFTYYLKPVDIQAPVSFERFIPNPTLGFAFANPADNIYIGFSHEVLRNAQLFWGWHWGFAKELVPRNDVSEDRDPAEPVTRDRRKRAFGVGLTFNINVIQKIFK